MRAYFAGVKRQPREVSLAHCLAIILCAYVPQAVKFLWLLNGNLIVFSWNLMRVLIFLGGSDGKESACSAGDPGSIPGSGRSPGEGNGNSLQYSCLENPMDGGAWWATVHGVTKSQTRLSDFTFTFFLDHISKL